MVGRDVPRVVVIGAGFGGLAAAVDLASAGLDVTIIERTEVPGGKARSVVLVPSAETSTKQPVNIDVGPTVLTMRWVFDELFASTGRHLERYVELHPLEILARHLWPDGSRLDLFADRARTFDAIASFANLAEAQRYLAFTEASRRIWEVACGPFVLSQRPSFTDLLREVRSKGLGTIARIDGHRTMWRALEESFTDPRLRQLYGRYATYCGGSPFELPATFNLVAHVESQGVHVVSGGISALARALAVRATELGARIRYEAPMADVLVSGTGTRVAGVRLASGEVIEADIVVSNIDVSALGSLTAGRYGGVSPTKKKARSLSALTWALSANTDNEDSLRSLASLAHHTVAFSSDYTAEMNALFREHRVSSEPTVYIARQGEERLLLVVNAPPTGDEPDQWTDEELRRCENAVHSLLNRCGIPLKVTGCQAAQRSTPVDFERAYPETGGALYGPRPRGPLSSLFRQGARTKLKGLYLAGGSVHPGPGVPMATLSGRLAASSIRQDLDADLGSDSITRSRPVATSGTTSMV